MPADMKNMIAASLASLAKQKGIDKVTVKAVIEDCHISRQTFYYHFRDIMDVVEWATERMTKKMLARSLEAETLEEAVHIFISSVTENQSLIQKLLCSQKREQIEKMFVEAARTYLQEMLKNKAPELSLSYYDMEVLLDFTAYGLTGLFFKYGGQPQMDSQKLAASVCKLLSGRLFTGKPDEK